MAPKPISNDEATASATANASAIPVQPLAASTFANLLPQAPPSEGHDIPPPSSPSASIVSSMPPPSLQQFPYTPGPSTNSTMKWKYSAVEASQLGQASSVGSGKKQCSAVPGTVALNRIKESLDMFNKTIERSLVVQPQEHICNTSPEHHTKAITHLQEIKTYLDDMCMIALIDLQS